LAVDSNNQIGSTQNSIGQNTSTSGSPWEEELDLPETPPKSQPTVIGSLDPKNSDETEQQPVPFNVPENIEEKVGQKMPAEAYMGPNEQAVSPSTNINSTPTVGAASTNPQANAMPASTSISPMPASIPPNNTIQETPTAQIPTDVSTPNIGAGQRKNIFSSIFNRMGKKNSPRRKKETIPVPQSPPSAETFSNKGLLPEPQKSGIEPAKDLTPSKKLAFLSGRRLVPVLGVIVFFGFLVGLTELGLLSVGVEKIYGAVGLEKIWGGLSNDPEQSFARSALEMQKHQNFKIKGTITLSVDSSINSQITSPLLSILAKQNYLAKRDLDTSYAVKALKTATSDSSGDVYDLYDTTASTSDSSSTDSSTSSSDTSESSSSDNDATDSSSATTDTNSTTQTETSSIQEVKASFQTKSNSEILNTSIDIEGASESSSIDLMLKNSNLLVRSDAYEFSENAETDKWLSFSLGKLEGKTLQKDFFSIDTESGISIKGKRASNEKIGETRCYKYTVDSIEIGNALTSLGITSDMVQNISGDIWIGINDKLIHKAELKIITPVSSSVSSFSISLEFYDFDLENKISLPDDSEIAVASGTPSESNSADNATTSPDNQRKNDVSKLLQALKEYKTANGSYPISTELLKLNSSNNTIEKALVPKYLSAWPSDPTDGWYYAYKSDGKKCSISARLENTSDSEGQMLGGVFLYLKYNNE